MNKFFKAVLAPFTDKDFDLDAPKLAGLAIVAIGIAIMLVCLIKWDFSPGPFGVGLVTLGGGLLNWRTHTDK